MSCEGYIFTIHGALRIGDIGTDVIKRARCEPGDGACKGTGSGGNSLFSPGRECNGRISRRVPDHAILGCKGCTQIGNVSIPGGCGGRNVGDRLGCNGRQRELSEGSGNILIAIHHEVVWACGANYISAPAGEIPALCRCRSYLYGIAIVISCLIRIFRHRAAADDIDREGVLILCEVGSDGGVAADGDFIPRQAGRPTTKLQPASAATLKVTSSP